MNLLGLREPEIYGRKTYEDLVSILKKEAEDLDVSISFMQSNHEGDIVDAIQQAYPDTDGILINPAAYTHTSVAILDAVKAVGIPTVEIHMSDVNGRDEFRKISYIREACIGTFMGKGFDSYIEAFHFLLSYLRKED